MREQFSDVSDAPFVPPAPTPRRRAASLFEMIRIAYRNPLELWGEAAFSEPWVVTAGARHPVVIANDPQLIRRVLVDNARNYRLSTVRQNVLRPMLRDGLLTAEGEIWKRSRKAMAPVFTPRHIFGFAPAMLACAEAFASRYQDAPGRYDIAHEMTVLTYGILAQTLFSGEIAGGPGSFADATRRLFNTMGRVDPLDILRAPAWLPRLTRLRGRSVMRYFRAVVAETIRMREHAMQGQERAAPEDFLTLLLRAQGPHGLTREEVEDNIITFIGAGHETTARALGWTLYCLAEARHERALVEDEIDRVVNEEPDPARWLERMPFTRAAFEEALRLYPPAPSINREAVEADRFGDLTVPRGAAVLVMPWTIHRHQLYWKQPAAFLPSRFHPGNREKIDRFQYLPFGAGPRICIGASFAMQEAVIALAVLLRRFRFDTVPGTRPWPVQKLTTQPENGLPMTVSLRR